MSNPSRHLFVSRRLVEAIEDDLRDEVEEEVREEFEEDFRDRLAEFAVGGETDDELFIGLDPENEQDIGRARERAEQLLEARIEWIIERRIEVAAARLADNVDSAITERMVERFIRQDERDKPLLTLRKRALGRVQPARRIARSRSAQAR